MKCFSIDYDVTSASGNVTFTVKAKSKEEAIELLKNGEGAITFEEVQPHYNTVDYDSEVYEDDAHKPEDIDC